MQSFLALFNAKEDPKKIYLDFKDSRVTDSSAIEAINNIVEKYKFLEKEVYIKSLSPDCQSVVKKADNYFEAPQVEHSS